MVDFYKILGVGEDATPEQIKKAFRQKCFEHHPDLNPGDSKASQQKFREVNEAYQVLRDKGKRSQYDIMRRAGFTAAAEEFDAGAAAASQQYGPDDFERAFEEWWKKMGEEFKDYAEERVEQERMSAERIARAAAWEREKQEAKFNKERAERLRQRTEDARHLRHAKIMRQFWQTHGGLTRFDLGLMAAVVAASGGLAYAWKLHLGGGEGGEQRAQQAQRHLAAAT